MSDVPDSPRRPNFAEAPATRSRGGRRAPAARPAAPEPPRPTPQPPHERRSGRRPVLLAVAAVVLFIVLVTAVLGVLRGAAGPASAQPDSATPPATDVPTGTAPPATPPRTSPVVTRPLAEENGARRLAFLDTMRKTGLTTDQANCVADRVEATMGWGVLSETLMDPGRPGQLEGLMVECLKVKK